MTTPNASWIPQPCFLYRDVSLRQDGFLGHEDPVFWPQLYSETFPYLGCIPLRSSPDSDADFFQRGITPEAVEFTEPITAFPRNCRLSPADSSRCGTILGRVKSTFALFTAKHGSHRHKRLDTIVSQIVLACGSITRLEGAFLELRFRFALLCRLFLELEAYYLFHGLCGSHEFSMDVHPVDDSLVGTITTEEDVCCRFHRMGIPVWLIRRLEPNHGSPCQLFTDRLPRNPDSRKIWPHNQKIVVTRVPHVHPVFEGPFEDSSYLLRICDWVRDCFRTELGSEHPLHPFLVSYQRKPRPTTGQSAGSSKKRKAQASNKVEPPKKTKRHGTAVISKYPNSASRTKLVLTWALQRLPRQQTTSRKVCNLTHVTTTALTDRSQT